MDDLASIKQDIDLYNEVTNASDENAAVRHARLAHIEKAIQERDELIKQLQAENEKLRLLDT